MIHGNAIQIFKQRQSGSTSTWTICKEKAHSVPSLFANYDKLLKRYAIDERYNLFYTVAHCINNRELVSQKIIPFDLDDADETKISLYTDIFTAVVRVYSPDVTSRGLGIVWTGNGLHFLLEVEEAFEGRDYFKRYKDAYKQLIAELNDQIGALGLRGKFDPVVFSHARLMRIPGTKNIKKEKERECYLINGSFIPYANTLTYTEKDEKDDEPSRPEYIYDVTAIQNECGFLKDMKANQENQSEPQWFAVTSLLSRVPSGKRLVHEYSKEYSGYDFDETEQKIEHSLKSPPQTCAHICTIWEGCSDCPHLGLVKTPLALRGYDVPQYSVKTEGKDVPLDKDSPEPKKKLPEFFRHFNPKTNRFSTPKYDELYDFHKKKKGHIIFFDPKNRYYRHNASSYLWEEYSKLNIEVFAQKHLGPKRVKPCTTAEAKEFYEHLKRENAITDERFFNPPGLIPFSNGVIQQIGEGVKFHEYETIYKDVEPKETYAFNYKHNFPYDADADCPLWRKFLDEVTCNNNDIKKCLQEYTGAALFRMPNNKIQKALILHGTGANGKSVFLDIITHILHETNIYPFSLAHCGDEKQRANLVGKVASIRDETPRTGLLEDDSFKLLVGGGRMDYRALYHDPLSCVFDAKFFISCNNLPFTNDISKGLLRRLLLVPFAAYFAESKQDKNLAEKLKAEAPGIINWAIEGAKNVLKNDYAISYANSALNLEQVQDFKRENNPIYDWIENNCRFGEAFKLNTTSAFDSFKREVDDFHHTKSKSKFTRDLKATLLEMYPDKEWRSLPMRFDGKISRGIYGLTLEEDFLREQDLKRLEDEGKLQQEVNDDW